MIEKREVIQIKIPYPNMQSGLAKKSHMYICVNKVHSTKRLVKCQTMKLPNIIGSIGVACYIIESPNIDRNPFSRPTMIDCDKLFIIDSLIPRSLLTKPRSDISEELHSEIAQKLKTNLPSRHRLSKEELKELNSIL